MHTTASCFVLIIAVIFAFLAPVILANPYGMFRSILRTPVLTAWNASKSIRINSRAVLGVIHRTYLDATELLEEREQIKIQSDAQKLPRPVKLKRRFLAPWDPYGTHKTFTEFLYWMYTRRTPKHVTKEEAPRHLPIRRVDPALLGPSDEPKMTWVCFSC